MNIIEFISSLGGRIFPCIFVKMVKKIAFFIQLESLETKGKLILAWTPEWSKDGLNSSLHYFHVCLAPLRQW